MGGGKGSEFHLTDKNHLVIFDQSYYRPIYKGIKEESEVGREEKERVKEVKSVGSQLCMSI